MKVIKFSASWCCRCRQIKPEWDKLKETYPQVEFVEIDCDNCSQQIIDEYCVKELPTIVYETEDKLKEWNGNQKLNDWMKECLH